MRLRHQDSSQIVVGYLLHCDRCSNENERWFALLLSERWAKRRHNTSEKRLPHVEPRFD